jgi:hypothetical protein
VPASHAELQQRHLRTLTFGESRLHARRKRPKLSAMSFIAEASIILSVSPEIAFDALRDHPSWKKWMPRSFVPTSDLGRPLEEGDVIRVRVAGAPFASKIRVVVIDRAREITWAGGIRGVLHGRHRFLFEPHERGTRVTSAETWSGAVAAITRPALSRAASKVGLQQLRGLERACAPS